MWYGRKEEKLLVLSWGIGKGYFYLYWSVFYFIRELFWKSPRPKSDLLGELRDSAQLHVHVRLITSTQQTYAAGSVRENNAVWINTHSPFYVLSFLWVATQSTKRQQRVCDVSAKGKPLEDGLIGILCLAAKIPDSQQIVTVCYIVCTNCQSITKQPYQLGKVSEAKPRASQESTLKADFSKDKRPRHDVFPDFCTVDCHLSNSYSGLFLYVTYLVGQNISSLFCNYFRLILYITCVVTEVWLVNFKNWQNFNISRKALKN